MLLGHNPWGPFRIEVPGPKSFQPSGCTPWFYRSDRMRSRYYCLTYISDRSLPEICPRFMIPGISDCHNASHPRGPFGIESARSLLIRPSGWVITLWAHPVLCLPQGRSMANVNDPQAQPPTDLPIPETGGTSEVEEGWPERPADFRNLTHERQRDVLGRHRIRSLTSSRSLSPDTSFSGRVVHGSSMAKVRDMPITIPIAQSFGLCLCVRKGTLNNSDLELLDAAFPRFLWMSLHNVVMEWRTLARHDNSSSGAALMNDILRCHLSPRLRRVFPLFDP